MIYIDEQIWKSVSWWPNAHNWCQLQRKCMHNLSDVNFCNKQIKNSILTRQKTACKLQLVHSAARQRTSTLAASEIYWTAESGAHATHSRTWSCSLSSALHSALLTIQTRAVWSLLQLSSNEPSWFGLTWRTHSRCPVRVLTQYLTQNSKCMHPNHWAIHFMKTWDIKNKSHKNWLRKKVKWKKVKVLKIYSATNTKSSRGTWKTEPNYERSKLSYQSTC